MCNEFTAYNWTFACIIFPPLFLCFFYPLNIIQIISIHYLWVVLNHFQLSIITNAIDDFRYQNAKYWMTLDIVCVVPSYTHTHMHINNENQSTKHNKPNIVFMILNFNRMLSTEWVAVIWICYGDAYKLFSLQKFRLVCLVFYFVCAIFSVWIQCGCTLIPVAAIYLDTVNVR